MAKLDRRQFIGSLGTAAAFTGSPALAATPRSDRPNIVFILADDLGHADLSCYGRRDYQTPHIDGLAAQGLRFTQAYANAPVCSPTRLALATGRYQYRLAAGLQEPIGARGASTEGMGLPPSHPTVASILRASGYRTALLGKWHLGDLPHYGPLKSGYEQFFGITGGGVDYVSHTTPVAGLPDLYEGEQLVRRDGYLTELLSARAVEYIGDARRHRAPFFLSLHYTAPHWPWQAPGDARVTPEQALFHLDGGSLEIYARMMRSLDDGVGRVLGALRTAGLEGSTLVVFTSDNGGERFSDNWPLTGQKMDLLEGGIRVPQLVRWPETVRAGTTTSQVAITMDWLPTLLSVAGTAADPGHPPDGVDLARVLRDGTPLPQRELCWRMLYRNQAALRAGDWKYLRIGADEFLFDLATDTRERANLRAREPQRFAQLKARYEDWNARMLPLPATQRRYFGGKEMAGY